MQDISSLYKEKLETRTAKTCEFNLFGIGRYFRVFGIIPCILPVLAIKEETERNVITAYLFDDSLESVIRRCREQYIKEHNAGCFFKIMKTSSLLDTFRFT